MISAFLNVRFTGHALSEMQKRQISKELVSQILGNPDRVIELSKNRIVLHKTLVAEDLQKAVLYRVFIDTDCLPPAVVTVYRTSKIQKYETMQ